MSLECLLYLHAIIFVGMAASNRDTLVFDGVMFFQMPLEHIPLVLPKTVTDRLPAKLKPLASGASESLQKQGLDAYRLGKEFQKHLTAIGLEMAFDDPAHRKLARRMATLRADDPLIGLWRPQEHLPRKRPPRQLRQPWFALPPRFVNPVSERTVTDEPDSTEMYPPEITRESTLPMPQIATQDMPRTVLESVEEQEHVQLMPQTRTQDIPTRAQESKRKHNHLDAIHWGSANRQDISNEQEYIRPMRQTRMQNTPRTMLKASGNHNRVGAIHRDQEEIDGAQEEKVEQLQGEQESMQEYVDTSDQEYADTSDEEYEDTSERSLPAKRSHDWLEDIRQDVEEKEEELEDEEALDRLANFDPEEGVGA